MKNLIPKRVMEYIIITFAVVLMDVGIYVFKFPNNFSFGGVSGLAVVATAMLPFTASQINLVVNMLLLLLGFLFLGKGFGVKTAYVTVLSSVLLDVMEIVFPMKGPLTDDPMLELVYAITLPAVASAILFYENASSGGTDARPPADSSPLRRGSPPLFSHQQGRAASQCHRRSAAPAGDNMRRRSCPSKSRRETSRAP